MTHGYTIHNSPGWVMTANCEDFAVWYPGAAGFTRYTGPGAYEEVTAALYDAGLVSAYYHTRDYWGFRCPYTNRHTCGL
jgi:hypothetical protein